MRYIKYIGLFVIHALLYVLAIVMFPIAYFTKPKSGFFWWFLNDTNMYGYGHEKYWKHYGKETFWVAYVWNVKRNSHWNFRIYVMTPKQGEAENVKVHESICNFTSNKTEEQLGMEFRNFEKHGKQFAEYSKQGSDYFRWSETKMVRYLFFIKLERSLMFGWSNSRWIFKIRHRTPTP